MTTTPLDAGSSKNHHGSAAVCSSNNPEVNLNSQKLSNLAIIKNLKEEINNVLNDKTKTYREKTSIISDINGLLKELQSSKSQDSNHDLITGNETDDDQEIIKEKKQETNQDNEVYYELDYEEYAGHNLISRKDSFGQYYVFRNRSGNRIKYYYDNEGSKFDKKLSCIKDIPMWLNSLSNYLRTKDFDTVTTLKEGVQIDKDEEEIIRRIIISSLCDDMEVYDFEDKTGLKCIQYLKELLRTKYNRKDKDKLWNDIIIDEYCCKPEEVSRELKYLVNLEIWSYKESDNNKLNDGFFREKLEETLTKTVRKEIAHYLNYGKIQGILSELKPKEYIDVISKTIYMLMRENRDNTSINFSDNKKCMNCNSSFHLVKNCRKSNTNYYNSRSNNSNYNNKENYYHSSYNNNNNNNYNKETNNTQGPNKDNNGNNNGKMKKLTPTTNSTNTEQEDESNKKEETNTKYTKKIENQENTKNILENQENKKNTLRQVKPQEQINDKVAIDTAAGIHLTHKKDWLLEFQDIIQGPEYYGVGNDENPINIAGVGKLPIRITEDEFIYVEAYYAPDEDATILSADKLWNEVGITLERGYGTLIGKNFDTKTTKLGNTIWVDAEKILDLEHTNDSSNNDRKIKIRAVRPINPTKRNELITLIEAHLRLNHFPASGIIKSIELGNFDDVKQVNETKKSIKMWCEICASGRIHRHFHYTGSMNHYSSQKLPGTSWSLDLFGPVANVRERFMLVMIDSVSRYTIATTHSKKHKDEIGKQIETNIHWVEKQFGTPVKELLMDRGKEFDNSVVEEMSEKEGIDIIYTSTEDHQANGRAERGIRTIIEDTRTLLLQARLPLRFWTYAARAAVNVRNCLYNKNVGESPLMNISNHSVKINLRSFLPFGAPAMIWDHNTPKTQAPGKKAITLSKDPRGFGYHFYIPKERKTISTTNYILPDYTIDHGVKELDGQQDIIGTFLNEMKTKIGDVNDTEYDEDEINKELPIHIEETMEDDDQISYEDDEVRITKYLLHNNDNEERLIQETNIHPKDIENVDLDSIFDDIETEEEISKPEVELEQQDEPELEVEQQDEPELEVEHQHEPESELVKQNESEISTETIVDEEVINNKDELKEPTTETNKKDELIEDKMEENIIDPDYNEDDDKDFVPSDESDEEFEDISNSEDVIDELEVIDIKADNLITDEVKIDEINPLKEKEIFNLIKNKFKKKIQQKKSASKSNQRKSTSKSHRQTKFPGLNTYTTSIRKSQQNINPITEHDDDDIEVDADDIDNDIYYDTSEYGYTDEKLNTTEVSDLNKTMMDDITNNHPKQQKTEKKGFPLFTKPLHSLDKKNKKNNKKNIVSESLMSSNISNLPKINIKEVDDKYEEKKPQKVVKRKIIRLIYPPNQWEDDIVATMGVVAPTRKIRAMFYRDAITKNKDLNAKVKFIEAYNKELNNLVKMNVIDLDIKIDKSKIPKSKLVPINSIFTIKRDGTYKARIVCRGDLQSESSYNDIETAILNMDSLKILLILANNRNMKMRTLDINHAFLYADLEEEIYITHPKDPKKATPLRKSLYGLKQSPKRWNDTLKEYMNSIGLFDNVYSPGLFISKDGDRMVAAYVDDCIIATKTEQGLDEIVHKLESKFSLKLVGEMKGGILNTDILGMDLNYDDNKGEVRLGMSSYIEKLKDQYPKIINNKMKQEKVPHIYNYEINPKENELIMKKDEYKEKVKYLQELIGKLNYIRSRGRLDIEFAVSKVARLTLYPHEKVIKAAEKILRYIYQTKEVEIKFIRERIQDNFKITAVTDASLATEFDLKSRSGGIIWLGNNYFHGFSKKSSIICDSSAEAELDAINTTEKLALLLKLKIEKMLRLDNIEINLITDSKPALDWLKQDYFKARTKFLGLRVERVKERLNDKLLTIRKIKGIENVADPLTKPVTTEEFNKLQEIIQHEITPEVLLPITVIW